MEGKRRTAKQRWKISAIEENESASASANRAKCFECFSSQKLKISSVGLFNTLRFLSHCIDFWPRINRHYVFFSASQDSNATGLFPFLVALLGFFLWERAFFFLLIHFVLRASSIFQLKRDFKWPHFRKDFTLQLVSILTCVRVRFCYSFSGQKGIDN